MRMKKKIKWAASKRTASRTTSIKSSISILMVNKHKHPIKANRRRL